MVHITAPDGKKIRDTRTEQTYSEVYTEERNVRFFVVADSSEDPIVDRKVDGVTLDERVSDLEDGLIELASIIMEG